MFLCLIDQKFCAKEENKITLSLVVSQFLVISLYILPEKFIVHINLYCN